MNMLNLPKKVYFKNGSMAVALRELKEVYHLKRAFLVSNPKLFRSGTVSQVGGLLRGQGIRTAGFFSISAPPTFSEIRSALPKLLEFEPDVIVGVGGCAAMSAAKAMWMLYENPALDLAEAAENPQSIDTGALAKLVLVATSFGSGAQNTPFAMLRNDQGELCVITSFQLLPEISITDSGFTEGLTPEQVRICAMATLSQAVRTFVSPGCSAYTQGLLREAVRLILQNLKQAEAGRPEALEKLDHAASMAGAAYGNVLLDTIDLTASFYPAEARAQDARIVQLARELDFSDGREFLDACKALC